MRFNLFFILIVLTINLSFAGNGKNNQHPSDTTLVTAIDTAKKRSAPNRILFDINGIFAQGRNSQFFNGYFEKGTGIQIAFTVYTSRFYSIRFKTAYINYKFDGERFRYANEIDVDLKLKNPETITLLPDVVIHPLPDFFINPYVFLGLGMQIGSRDAAVTYLDESTGKYVERIYQLGSRYIGQAGFGISKKIHDRIHLNACIARNVEFLENTQSKDIFYNFKETVDGRYKYNYFCFGFQYMIR